MKCWKCGCELETGDSNVNVCNRCKQEESRKEYFPFLEPHSEPHTYLGIKCPHCNKEIQLVVYKARTP